MRRGIMKKLLTTMLLALTFLMAMAVAHASFPFVDNFSYNGSPDSSLWTSSIGCVHFQLGGNVCLNENIVNPPGYLETPNNSCLNVTQNVCTASSNLYSKPALYDDETGTKQTLTARIQLNVDDYADPIYGRGTVMQFGVQYSNGPTHPFYL